ncbi:MAG: hypothetical protein ACM3QS_15435 [Bacteroidota bacterium]
MKVIKNEKLIKRNAKVGQWTSLAGIVVLAGGMYISLRYQTLFNYALGALLIGFILTQVSLYLGNRFGRSPRPDESLDAGLKGLSGDFTIYHYTTPASHLLVGPAGIWVLLPYRQAGRVTYRNNRWRMGGGGFMQGYMRIFGQEGIGRPDAEARSEIKTVQEHLAKRMEGIDVPPVQAAIVFTNDQVEIEPEEAPMPALKPRQLKEFLRQKGKERALTSYELTRVNAALQ